MKERQISELIKCIFNFLPFKELFEIIKADHNYIELLVKAVKDEPKEEEEEIEGPTESSLNSQMEDEPAMMGSSSSQGFCSLSRLAEITLAAEGKLEGKDSHHGLGLGTFG